MERRINFRSFTDTLVLVLCLVTLLVVFSLTSPNFASYANISTMLNNMVITLIIGIAITPVIIAQGLDISFGASLSLSTVIMAALFERGMPVVACLLIGLLLPVVVGIINGLLIEAFDLIPMILTLGTSFILIAFGEVITNGQSILMLIDELFVFATESLWLIPYPVLVFIVVFGFYWYVLKFTVFGRQVFFIGANPTAAKLSGIRVKQIKVILYVALGFITGISAILMISLSGIGYIYHGNNLTLPVLSGVFLGGMSLSGGKGSIINTIIGIAIVAVIFTGLSLMNVQFYFIQVFQGLALVIIVAFNEIRENRRSKA